VGGLFASRFVRSVVVVATGTSGAQAITMAFAPLITRIYGPEVFGHSGTFMAMVEVAIPLAALAYPIAIVLPRDDRDALGLARLSAFLSLGIALLTAAALWVGGSWLVAVFDAESMADFLLLVPLAMLFAAWTQIAQQWLIRKGGYAAIARAAIAQSMILNAAKAGIGWFHPTAATLIVITTLGHALHAALLFFGTRLRCQSRANEHLKGSVTSLPQLARHHRDFPLYRAPQNFINAASQSLPVLMLAALSGPASAGFYTLGRMVMGVPSSLVGKAVSDVFYPRITDAAHNGENLARHILRATGGLFAVGIVPFGLVVLFGRWLFSFVFGPEWAMAGEYARWLALFFLFNLINKPCVAAVPVLGIQRGLLVYEVFSTSGKLIGLALGFYWFDSDIWGVALFSVTGVVAYVVMMYWIYTHALRWGAHAKAG